ncbi:MAG: MMPL family transporter [Lachnospiraceae bacterium]|nr:MMPL family transporter [Lachnospiraceae bacterium]
MRLGKIVVKARIAIIAITLILCALSVLGMINTRINFDMLTYLPEDFETVKGQEILLEEFGKGGFSMVMIEGMDQKDVVELKKEFEKVDHVESVIWYDTFADINIPMEILPDELYEKFNSGSSTVMAVFFDTSTSADETIEAIRSIRLIGGEKVFVSGLSAMITDLKELCEKEEIIYVGIAVGCALIVMMLFLDSFLVPFVFLASIGAMILINMGTNFFLGETSYITKALAAVLQLAVTMDYSIFLWHSYNEYRHNGNDARSAMPLAVRDTLAAVVGSSITTIAGFIALCFMSYTLGSDLGIVMAKGVALGVIGSVTLLPAMILVLDKPLSVTRHKSLIPNCGKLSGGIIKIFPVFIIAFALLIIPAYYGYDKTNDNTYYTIADSLPEDMEFRVANKKLQDEYDMQNVQMILVRSDIPSATVREMNKKLEQIDGVKAVLGMESVLGERIPEEILPSGIKSTLESENWKLLLITSEYKIATDEIAHQIDEINSTLKSYDEQGLLIGEAACTQDLINVTKIDFQVVTWVSIAFVFLIVFFVEKSLSLPFILIVLIEVGIFINLGIPYYTGDRLPFITPICISTIQLGATVDYAILLTTKYKAERTGAFSGVSKPKKEAVKTALQSSIPSIIVSGAGLFAATFGVYVYTSIDMIGSMCALLARGAVISMILVIFVLPSLLVLCDGLIKKTTLGMKNCI